MMNEIFEKCGWNERNIFCLYWNEDYPSREFCEWCYKKKPDLPRERSGILEFLKLKINRARK